MILLKLKRHAGEKEACEVKDEEKRGHQKLKMKSNIRFMHAFTAVWWIFYVITLVKTKVW